ncbi:MAG TPA: 16S rRNA (guanine(966)-N(2))-methyltransferase RsmD [Alphaproteobacteria bacterium]|nr:16S rRNA (guanine(966)-N(2))-methyltransferase RsmD [Alphaproteobacteria bacterium]
MRIIAGTHRGRRLEAPADQAVRPTADRVREALFSILAHRLGGFAGKRVLDAFAGSGALGLEALSRGAESAVFMDKDRTALALCRRNAESLGLSENSNFLYADATKPPPTDQACGLVLLDPPYGKSLGSKALAALAEAGWVADGAITIIETDRTCPEDCPAGFEMLDRRDYGRTRILLLQKA